jgi:2-amino-4-hydroxy-6-hydroxymethyldihydropteridine diphosphokinase
MAGHTVYLSLGTNLGDRLANLRTAVRELSKVLKGVRTSSIYETEPWGYADQPAFLNMVLAGTTLFSPEDLLDAIKTLEGELGREKTFRYGPRKIDIDILFYDDLVLASEKLEIPHPRLTERAFVLVPLVELEPHLVHPLAKCTALQLLEGVDARGVKFVEEFQPQNTQNTQKKQ